MSRTRYQRQRPVKGGRTPVSAGLISEIEFEIARAQRRFRVSRSFVIAVALADYFKVQEQEHWERPAVIRQPVLRTVAGGRRAAS